MHVHVFIHWPVHVNVLCMYIFVNIPGTLFLIIHLLLDKIWQVRK